MVAGRALLPAAAMLEMCLASASTVLSSGPDTVDTHWGISQMTIISPVILPPQALTDTTSGNDDIIVQCHVDTVTGMTRLSYVGAAANAGASRGGRLVARCVVARLPPAKATTHAAADINQVSSEDLCQQPQSKLIHLAHVVGMSAVGFHIDIVNTSIGQVGFATDTTASTAVPYEGSSARQALAEEGYLFRPVAVDAALHLGVLQTGYGAKIPVAVAFFSAKPRRSGTSGASPWASGGKPKRMPTLAPPPLLQHAEQRRSVNSFFLWEDEAGAPAVLVSGLETIELKKGAEAAPTAVATALDVALAGKADIIEQSFPDTTDVMYETELVVDEPVQSRADVDKPGLLASANIDDMELVFVGGRRGARGMLRVATTGSSAVAAAASVVSLLQSLQTTPSLDSKSETFTLSASCSAVGHSGSGFAVSTMAAAAMGGVLRTVATELPNHAVHLTLRALTCSSSGVVHDGDGGGVLNTVGLGIPTGGAIAVRQLRPALDAPPAGPEAFQIVARPRGAFSNLAVLPMPLAADGVTTPCRRGEVAVVVKAVGLNFRDVLNVLGMYPGDPGAPGGDCAGVVQSVGENESLFHDVSCHLQELSRKCAINDLNRRPACAGFCYPTGPGMGSGQLAVGDAVFGLAHGCMGSRVVGPAAMLAHMPPHVTFAEAASVPTVSTM